VHANPEGAAHANSPFQSVVFALILEKERSPEEKKPKEQHPMPLFIGISKRTASNFSLSYDLSSHGAQGFWPLQSTVSKQRSGFYCYI